MACMPGPAGDEIWKAFGYEVQRPGPGRLLTSRDADKEAEQRPLPSTDAAADRGAEGPAIVQEGGQRDLPSADAAAERRAGGGPAIAQEAEQHPVPSTDAVAEHSARKGFANAQDDSMPMAGIAETLALMNAEIAALRSQVAEIPALRSQVAEIPALRSELERLKKARIH